MGFDLRGGEVVCSGHCSRWAETYMKYCLCSNRDAWSLGLGMLSVFCWGVAEVPQVVTNYKHKSAEGLSLAFLLTWILGDFFNIFGCLLEPATLPTQYYMAVLYTITTLVLTSQSIYYGHIYHRLNAHKQGHHDMGKESPTIGEEQVKHEERWTSETNFPSSPIAVAPVLPRYGSFGNDMYYMSARSLSKSHTPTAGSYLAQAIAHESTTQSVQQPLLGTLVHTQSAPPSNTKNMLCVIFAATFFLSSFNLHLSTTNTVNKIRDLPQGVVIRVGRKLLQNGGTLILRHEGEASSGIGTFLGWGMAMIYMGARLPQICLNIKRGNVEGLNPLMFIFALLGNLTYVGSILLKSVELTKILANLPWLVDAGGCILLDTFIILQFVYFHHRRSRETKNRHGSSPLSQIIRNS